MGQEIACKAIYNGQTSDGRAHLETDFLLFRGDFRVSVPFSSLTAVNSENGRLHLTAPDMNLALELGPYADKWAEKIRNPRSLLDKLGVKAGSRVAVLGVMDESFRGLLRAHVIDFLDGETASGLDYVFFAADSPAELARLGELKGFLAPTGAIWIVSLKGKGAPLKDTDVFAAARSVGLVDTKVCAFSATHTALKFVIPVGERSA